MMERKYYFSFDVESVGLLGRPFAVGWVIVDETGKEYEEGCLVSGTPIAIIKESAWIIENVIPALPEFSERSFLEDEYYISPSSNCYDEYDMYEKFWKAWTEAEKDYPGILMVTDTPFPVEAGFLLRMHREGVIFLTLENSPYPLIDVASVLFAHGHDPIANYDRKENEMPVHHPTKDARCSVRIMLECMKGEL